MNKQIADIIDVICLALFLSICMLVGVKALFQTNREFHKTELRYMDKNTKKKYSPSEKIYGTFDGTFSREEIITISQIQDYNMPYPNIIKYQDLEMQIQPGNPEYLKNYQKELWNKLKHNDEDLKYGLKYDYMSILLETFI